MNGTHATGHKLGLESHTWPQCRSGLLCPLSLCTIHKVIQTTIEKYVDKRLMQCISGFKSCSRNRQQHKMSHVFNVSRLHGISTGTIKQICSCFNDQCSLHKTSCVQCGT